MTAIINGVVVTGTVEEINQLILLATTKVSTAASSTPLSHINVCKNATGLQELERGE